MIKQALSKVIAGENLDTAEAKAVMTAIMTGESTPAQIAGFLVALRIKGETVEEITGSAAAMRDVVVRVQPVRSDLIDTCGTGGDGAGTFNISTTAAFVVAGAGLGVAKHGNRSVSSKSGSADVLMALGVNLDVSAEQMASCIDEVGIGFLFAPKLHPAMRHAIGPRRDLGQRTIFNILGPLTNPANAPTQLLGVYSPELTEVLANVLLQLGSKAACVVHGYDGLDELTTTGLNIISSFGLNGTPGVKTETLNPQTLGFAKADPADLAGGTPEENAEITRDILSGKDAGPRRDVVLLNSGMALYVGGKADSLEAGIMLARESIDSGKALAALNGLVAMTQAMAA